MLLSRFARPFFTNSKRAFDSLTEQEILALAISSEEEDARIYQTYADGLREEYPASAGVFDEMAAEEHEHRRMLLDLHQSNTQLHGDASPHTLKTARLLALVERRSGARSSRKETLRMQVVQRRLRGDLQGALTAQKALVNLHTR